MDSILITSGELAGNWEVAGASLKRKKEPFFSLYRHFTSIPYSSIESIGDFQSRFINGASIIKIKEVGFVEAKMSLLAFTRFSELVKSAASNNDEHGVAVYHEKKININNILFFCIVIFLFSSCEKKEVDQGEQFNAALTENIIQLKSFTHSDACRALVSIEFSVGLDSIHTKKEDDIYRVWYIRESDGKKFSYKCRVGAAGNITWANYPEGRWRDGSGVPEGVDTIFTYAESSDGKKLLLNSESVGSYEFKKEQF